MGERIDGWKAIGAHFNRDRTTVIRWANDRDLPVRRMPGGKRASVYALRSELDAWLASHGDVAAEPAPAEPPRPSRRRALWIGATLLLVIAAGIAALLFRPSARPEAALPVDQELARLYLGARDDWAERDAASLRRAIAGFAQVTRQEPGFAPAHAALADAYLLSREFGGLDDRAAFTRARAAATAALRLDPDLHAAHRALGFILYWRDRRPQEAARAFERALELQPDDAQTHFWYANILSDNGDHQAAHAAFDAARLRAPGSVAIQTDHAWALWAMGRGEEASAILEPLAARDPSFAAVHDCLSTIRLAEDDLAGHAEAEARLARLRGDRTRLARAERLRSLVPDKAAAHRQLLDWALADARTDPARSLAMPAFIASLAGDRAVLLSLLRRADARKELWGDAGLRLRIALAWDKDPEVTALLARRRPPAIA